MLEALPEPLRTMMREGRFDVGQKDREFQVIPTGWIVAAQSALARRTAGKAFAMTAMAFDPAGGGADAAELCLRHGGWYAPLVTAQGDGDRRRLGLRRDASSRIAATMRR